MYNLISFDICIHPYNYHINQDNEPNYPRWPFESNRCVMVRAQTQFLRKETLDRNCYFLKKQKKSPHKYPNTFTNR